MKYTPFLKKTLSILSLSLLLFALNACEQGDADTPAATDTIPAPGARASAKPVQPSVNTSPKTADAMASAENTEAEGYNDALAAFDSFLAGDINAQDIDHELSDGVISMKDISQEPELITYNALFDMNGDKIPELHLRPIVGGSYVIFTYQDGQLALWHEGPDYEAPLDNGAILYERESAAPTHINYYYLVLDSDGAEVSKVYFSKYHSVEEGCMTESDVYDEFIYEDQEVTEEEWNTLTQEYLSNSSDLIIWKE